MKVNSKFGWFPSVVLSLLTGLRCYAQAPSIQWEKSFGGSLGEMASCVQQTKDGGYIVAGSSPSKDGDVTGNHGLNDYWIVKLDNLGNIKWEKSYGGSDNDLAYCVKQTNDGGYVVAGSTQSNNGDVHNHHGANNEDDYWIVRIDSLGSLLWEKSLGGSGEDVAYNISLTNDGGFIVAGASSSDDGNVTGHHGTSNNEDCWIVKLDSIGNMEWEKSLGGTCQDIGWGIQQLVGGGYIVAGQSCSTDGDVTGNHGGEDYWIIRLDDSANIVWENSYGGSNDENVAGVQQTQDGGFVISGYTSSGDDDVTNFHGGQDFWIVKLDSTGRLQWENSFGGSGQDVPYLNIQQTVDDGYVVCGSSNSLDGDVSGNSGNIDYWIIKIDHVGILQWERCLGGSGVSEAYWIQYTNDGGFIVAGGSSCTDGDVTGNHGKGDYWIVKLAPAPQPEIFCPRERSIPNVLCNTRAYDTLSAHNVGAGQLIIDSVAFVGNIASYKIISPVGFPDSLSAGDSLSFVIRLIPLAFGRATTTLELFSNDTAHNPWQISISGRKDSVGFAVSGVKSDTIDFGYLNCGATKDSAFVLASTSTLATTFTLKNNNSDFVVAPNIFLDSGAQKNVSVHFVGAGVSGKILDSLMIVDTCGHEWTVYVTATIDTPLFVISIVADTTLCPTDSLVRFISVKNISHTTQSLQLAGNPALFSASPNNFSINAGDSVSVQIVFHGSPNVGAYSADYSLVDNCGGSHNFTATIDVDTSHIVVPLAMDSVVCPQTPVVFVLPIINHDLISRNISLTSSSWQLSRQNFSLPAGASDSVLITFSGGVVGAYSNIVHVSDDCGGEHDVALTISVRNFPPVQLSIAADPAATKVGDERKIFLIANPSSAMTDANISFTISNEPTALQFDSIATACSAAITRGLNTTTITINTCASPISDTIAELFYHTLIGSTLSPAVTLQNVSTTNTCNTVSGAGFATINLLPPGCELGTLIVHPFTSAIDAVYPNPSTGTTTVYYSTIENSTVDISVYDALGRNMQTIIHADQMPGSYAATFDTQMFFNGIYYLRMTEGKFVVVKEIEIAK